MTSASLPRDDDRLAAVVADLAEALRIAVARTEAASPGPERLLSVYEAAETLGIGRTALYDEFASGRLRSVKIGRRRLVPASAIAELVAGQQP